MTSELTELLKFLTPRERAELDALLAIPTAAIDWKPFPRSPQERAYSSTADVLGYGGAAGGGKTDLLLGVAMTQHRRSIIFRRHYTDLTAIVERGDAIQDGRCTFVWGVKRRWDTPDGRQIEVGAVEHEKDKIKYRGRPHDLIAIDEATDFSESAFRFVTGWLRTEVPTQRTRIILTFNPPTSTEGEWVLRYFAPWLDSQHPRPAAPGELRWFVRLDDEDVEVESSAPVEHNGEVLMPQSRTFIPARVEDNPFYMQSGYIDQLNMLPEPLRSQLRYGDFGAAVEDDPWQVMPTAWVLAAQERWRTGTRPDVAMRSAGVDVARGGKDATVIARLHGAWFDELLVYPGSATPDGATTARYVTDAVPGATPIFIDVIGYGASAYDHLRALPNVRVTAVNNSAGAGGTDRTHRYQFTNVRAESYWKLREALDPASGENIALPDSRELRVELCAARYKVVGGKIGIEAKDEIIARTGHSPDRADAVVMAWWGVSSRGNVIVG